MTRTSLLASAMRLARRRSRRARPRGPPCPTTRTARRRRPGASRPRPGRPRRIRRCGERAAAALQRRQASAAARVAIATGRAGSARPARRAAPRSRRPRGRRPAAGPGCASTTASALWPIEPVDPRMAMRFITTLQVHGCRRSRPARRRAASIRSSTPPWPGMSARGILHARAALQQRLEQIAGDAERHDRGAEQDAQRRRGAAGNTPAAPPTAMAVSAEDEAADRPFDRLLRADCGASGRRPNARPV